VKIGNDFSPKAVDRAAEMEHNKQECKTFYILKNKQPYAVPQIFKLERKISIYSSGWKYLDMRDSLDQRTLNSR